MTNTPAYFARVINVLKHWHPGPILIKKLFVIGQNKLKCLSVVSLSSLFIWLQVKSESIHVDHSSAPLKGRLLALVTNIRLFWKGLPGKNTTIFDNFKSYEEI